MKKNNVIKFPQTYTALFQCLCFILFSVVPFSLIYVGGSIAGLASFIFAAIPSVVFLYIGFSKVFKKKVIIYDDKTVFHHGPFSYKLDLKKMRVCYEKVWVLGGNYKDYFGLVLYRDREKIIGFSMSNKFVLMYEMDEVKFEYFQNEFKTKLGIEIDVIEPFF